MSLLQAARNLKHKLFVAKKRGRVAAFNAAIALETKYYDLTAGDYKFEYGRYRHEFVNRRPPLSGGQSKPVPKHIFCLWTGDNDLTPARAASLERIQAINGDFELILITPDNLDEFLVPEHPLHPAYEHLSLVHRSDYLRAYLMHHHGGGYSDIKTPHGSWNSAYERLQNAEDKWAVGYRELNCHSGARLPRLIGRDLRRHYAKLIGQGAYIMRPGTPLTAEWMRETEAKLDYYRGALAENPGDEFGLSDDYPIGWTNILGKTIGPLFLKYHDRLIIDDSMLLLFKNYR